MSLVVNFLNEFRDCLINGSEDRVLELNMPDDITGWGITESDDFNCLDDLYKRSGRYFAERESADIQLEPLDSFGNGKAMMIACRLKRDIQYKNGLRLKDDNIRLTFYLIEHQGELKIRHGHISKAWPETIAFPVDPIPQRPKPELTDRSARLDSISITPFLDALSKRVNYSESTDMEGLESLQHPSQSRIYFPIQGSGELWGTRQYTQYLHSLVEKYANPSLKYHHPVAFQDQSLVCLSAYADSSCLDKITGEKISVSPLRVTYVLQEHEGQWLCRHSHWSLPHPDVV